MSPGGQKQKTVDVGDEAGSAPCREQIQDMKRCAEVHRRWAGRLALDTSRMKAVGTAAAADPRQRAKAMIYLNGCKGEVERFISVSSRTEYETRQRNMEVIWHLQMSSLFAI